MAEPRVSLKLFIDPKSNRVIFAEAKKNFVDFIFNVLSLPLASLAKLVLHEGAVGNLYKSIENLGNDYIEDGQNKNTILKSEVPDWAILSPFLMLDKPTPKAFYRCSACTFGTYLHDSRNTTCPNCLQSMYAEFTYYSAKQTCNGSGFVKGSVTYMVTDDLVVEPLSTLSIIDLLQKYDFKDIGQLQQKEVNMGKNEALMMLKACIGSSNILTEVFLTPENDDKECSPSTKKS